MLCLCFFSQESTFKKKIFWNRNAVLFTSGVSSGGGVGWSGPRRLLPPAPPPPALGPSAQAAPPELRCGKGAGLGASLGMYCASCRFYRLTPTRPQVAQCTLVSAALPPDGRVQLGPQAFVPCRGAEPAGELSLDTHLSSRVADSTCLSAALSGFIFLWGDPATPWVSACVSGCPGRPECVSPLSRGSAGLGDLGSERADSFS